MKKQSKFLILFTALLIATLFFQRKIEIDVATAQALSSDELSKSLPISKTILAIPSQSKKLDEADLDKVARPNASEKNSLEAENKNLLCKLKSAHTNVPMQGDVQVFVSQTSPFFGNDADNVAWIKSDICPSGMYSIIHFSNAGRVSHEVDCRTTSTTEIATMSGEQGNIKEAPTKNGETNIAVSGNGYFVLNCPSRGLILTRDGKFQQTREGHLKNKEGCTLLNQNGNTFETFAINESGCNTNGDCIATIDPSTDEVYGLKYLNNHSFSAEDIGPLTDSVTKKQNKTLRPSFFINALEDIHNPERGLTSVSWSNHPYINLNEIECP